MSLRLVASCLFAGGLASAVAAQPASYSFFGSGCQNPPVIMTVAGVPQIGSTFTVGASGPYLTQFGTLSTWILIGLSNTQWGPIQLPFPTSVLSSPGTQFCGDLRVSIDAIILVPPAKSGKRISDVPFTIPSQPALVGSVFYQQVLEFHTLRPITGTRGIMVNLSRGGQATIGI